MNNQLEARIIAIEDALSRLSRIRQEPVDQPRAAVVTSQGSSSTTNNVDISAIRAAFTPVFITETEVFSSNTSTGGYTSIDVSSVVPSGATMVWISGFSPNDKGGGPQTPSTIRVRKDSGSESHYLCVTSEFGLSGVYSMSHTIVPIASDRTFEADVVVDWDTGTPPDAKIFVYAYII